MVRRLKKKRRSSIKLAKCETTGKACYLSKGHALSATLHRAVKGGQPLRAYRCPDCGFWHMTSQTHSKRKAL